MLRMDSYILRDGVLYGGGFLVAGAAVGALLDPWWGAPLYLLAAFCLYFFRNPERVIPDGPVAVCPADGKVVQILSLEDGTRRVSIFLNIFDVHVNRSPISGSIVEQQYRPGRFHMAQKEAASLENEQNTITIENAETRVVVKQIAGLIARRIVCNKGVGDKLKKGERFGLIKFGSRTDTFLGPEWVLAVQTGDRVRGGSSILARLEKQQA